MLNRTNQTERSSEISASSFHGMHLKALPRKGADMRVVLVDDNALFLNTLKQQLERKRGIQIIGCATNGSDGLRLAAELKPDVMILDLAMPHMSGLEVTQNLKSQAHPPRVVILSLYDEPEYRERALQVGADAYLVKSAIHADLVPLLCALCA